MCVHATPPLKEQKCRWCGVVLPISNYYKSVNRRTGYDDRCKSCLRAYNRKYHSRRAKELTARTLDQCTYVTHKRCYICQQTLPIDSFYLNLRCLDGHDNKCKQCAAERQRVQRRAWRNRAKPELTHKKCHTCHKLLDIKEFTKYASSPDGYTHDCSWCRTIRHRKIKYGISSEVWDHMVQAQAGRCAICGVAEDPIHLLCVDHSHSTGKVRSLLCSACNWLLGNANDNIQTLQYAIEYLKRHNP